MTTINQKEYLKKYLGINKAPGEKKKKKKIRGDRLKIIDDDANGIMSQEIKEDLAADNEDTPQIVAVIDDRPPSMRIDEQTKNNLWQPIGENYSSPNETKTLKLLSGFKINKFKSSEMQDSQKSQIGIAERQSRTQIKCNRELSTMQEIDYSPPRKSIKVEQESPRRKESAEDHSPIRKTKTDNSLLRKERSSPYKREYNDDGDYSPPRKRSEHSPTKCRNKEEDRDYSPLRRDKRKRQSRWKSRSPDASPKRSTTLDGKKAGLQNAKDLVKETVLLKQKEEQLFQSMPEELSGKSAATVVREKKKKIEDPEEEARRFAREQEMKDKYDRWGKGLKQVEAQNEKITEQLHEMNKPLARYADDEDLERYLKEQEREGDPMLNYIRKKKKKHAVETGISEKPTYKGEFMPNRFGVCPGYRWDGVDRSNGYERRWFEVLNTKRANQEEAFKWSTEDM